MADTVLKYEEHRAAFELAFKVEFLNRPENVAQKQEHYDSVMKLANLYADLAVSMFLYDLEKHETLVRRVLNG